MFVFIAVINFILLTHIYTFRLMSLIWLKSEKQMFCCFDGYM